MTSASRDNSTDNVRRDYAIGEVAQLTGLSSHSIRKWETRHDAVTPQRTEGGTRRYSSHDVSRLTLLKELVDAGGSIAKLATLDDASLKARCVEAMQPRTAQGQGKVRVGVIGESLPAILLQHRMFMANLTIVPAPFEPEEVDLLIVEEAALQDDISERLSELRDRFAVDQVVVLYGFAPQHVVLRLSNEHTACVRMPVNYIELQRTVLALNPPRPAARLLATAPPRYSKALLAKVSGISTSIECECPRHVAELLMALADFETYSANCEDRNPLDAAVHNYLKLTASQARDAFEQALATVATHENIPLDQMAAETLPH